MLTKDGPWMHGFGHLQHMPSHTFVRLGQVSNAPPDRPFIYAVSCCICIYINL